MENFYDRLFFMNQISLQGINFLKLKGTALERASLHGRFIKDNVEKTAIPLLANFNEGLIRGASGISKINLIKKSASWIYHHMVLQKLKNNLTYEQRQMVDAFVSASGVPFEQLISALFQSDGLMLLSRISVMKYILGDLPADALLGCSSTILGSSWTKNKKLLAMRNLDYPAVGPWEKNHMVLFNEPSEKGLIPHVGITTSGLHTSGITSMNKEGITLAVHAHFSKGVSLNGSPIFLLGDEIISKAKTISEAIDLAKKFKKVANWTFVIGSAKEDDSVAIEMTPSQTVVRHAQEGYISHTNFFQSQKLQSSEALISGGAWDNFIGRIHRMKQIFEPLKGSVEPQHMMEALGDLKDYQDGKERAFGNTISMLNSIQSVVMEPESQTLWASNRQESPTGLGNYIEVNLDNFWQQKKDTKLKTYPGYRPKNKKRLKAISHYRDAYIAWHINNHLPDYKEKTLKAIRRGIKECPEDGNLWMQAGIVAFNLKRFDQAFSFFKEAKDKNLIPHISQVRDLFLARCYDLKGQRAQAKELYKSYSHAKEPKLRKALKMGLLRKYHPFQTHFMTIDLQFPDAFHY